MSAGDSKSQPALGFLTILEHEQHGLVGGYLILNLAGRPLEFHCTAPVKPSRAQQILFGPTLQPYLYGEQIGQTLIGKGAIEPVLVCTNVELVLSVREYVSLPVALVLRDPQRESNGTVNSSDSASWRIDAPHAPSAAVSTFHVGQNLLAVAAHRDDDRRAVFERLESLSTFDLSEPFDRILEAVEEAQKGGRA